MSRKNNTGSFKNEHKAHEKSIAKALLSLSALCQAAVDCP